MHVHMAWQNVWYGYRDSCCWKSAPGGLRNSPIERHTSRAEEDRSPRMYALVWKIMAT